MFRHTKMPLCENLSVISRTDLVPYGKVDEVSIDNNSVRRPQSGIVLEEQC